MGAISHLSDGGEVLGCSHAMLRNIADEALKMTSDTRFVQALEGIELYGHIELYRFSDECKIIFSNAAEAVAKGIESKTEEHPDYVARLRMISEEVKKTIKEVKP